MDNNLEGHRVMLCICQKYLCSMPQRICPQPWVLKSLIIMVHFLKQKGLEHAEVNLMKQGHGELTNLKTSFSSKSVLG